MRCVIYTRQSMDKRNTQSSIQTQDELIRDHITKSFPEMYTITSYSDVATGRNAKRHDFKRLVHHLKNEPVEYLFLYRINRLTRDIQAFNELLLICRQHAITIVSLSDGIFRPDSPYDHFKAQLIGTMAEIESNNIGNNYRQAFKEKAKEQKILSARAPWGYEYKDGQFIAIQDRIPTIKAVFDLYCSGNGYKKISQLLCESDNLKPRNPQQVGAIITNSKYSGFIRSKYASYFSEYIEPIVSYETFERAERIRLSNQHERTPGPNAILRKKMPCPLCGAIMTPIRVNNRGKVIEYYDCSNKRQSTTRVCEMRQVRIDVLDKKVRDSIANHLKTNNLLDIEAKIVSLVSERYSIKNNETPDKLVERLATGELDTEQFKNLIRKAKHHESKKDSILSGLDELERTLVNQIHSISTESLNRFINHAEISPNGTLNALIINKLNIVLKEKI